MVAFSLGDDSWACKAVAIGSSGGGICVCVASLATSAVDEQTATHVWYNVHYFLLFLFLFPLLFLAFGCQKNA